MCYHFCNGTYNSIQNDWNFCNRWYFSHQDATTLPTCSSCSGRQCFPLLYNCRSKKAFRYNYQIVYPIFVIVHKEEARIIQRCNTINHCSILPIRYNGLKAICINSLTFEFILRFTIFANIILHRSICFNLLNCLFPANWAVHIASKPIFCQYTGNLTITIVPFSQRHIKIKVHNNLL